MSAGAERTAISVIIPTTAQRERAASLRRAIASVRAQENVDLDIIVVVNGPRHDAQLLTELRADPTLRAAFLEEASLPAAHRHGRHLVDRPFFSFLDDDDEYLPGALALRAAAMRSVDAPDVVATNGVWATDGCGPYIPLTDGVEDDPMAALLRSNWLGSGGALFRTATVGPDIFDGHTRFFEWTMIAFRIALAGLRVRFLDVPTFRMTETPGSLSRTSAYYEAQPEFLESLLQLTSDSRHRDRIRAKLLGAEHYLAELHCRNGNLERAWKHHLRSMRGRSGMKHVIFTRRLLLPTLRSLALRLPGSAGVR
jgi:glycosyltransferase involved in cell wall biosynthesis